MHLFYTPDIDGDAYYLNETESKHCIQVLRLSVGTHIILVDGKGGYFTAEITSANKRTVALKVITSIRDYGKRPNRLHIAVAPTKNIDRMEWFLEKATEIGIDEITPVICDRSERKQVKDDRLIRIITSAVKQSQQAYHPELHPQEAFEKFVKADHAGYKFIAHCIDDDKHAIGELLPAGADCVILIGPEGDFTPAEIALALQNGYKPITLGNTRLRTETAALAACFEVNYINR